MTRRIVVFSYPYLTRTLKQILDENTLDQLNIIEESFERLVSTARYLMENEEADYFISGGSNAKLLRANFPAMPLITIEIRGSDLIESIVNASSHGSNIAIITFQECIPEIDKLKKVVNVNIIQHKFNNEIELQYIVKRLKDGGIDVIIGSSIVCEYAEKNGLPGIFIYCERSIKESIDKAIFMRNTLMVEKKKTNQMNAIIDFAYSGIIAIDENKKISALNPIAEKITGLSRAKVLGKIIGEVIPNSRLEIVLKTGQKECNQLQKLNNNITLLTNRVPIMVNGEACGAVATFQDVAEIRKAERHIRVSLGQKGLIAKYTFNDIIGQSESIRRAKELARIFAMEDSTVLLDGATGTGKELFANSIHNHSSRSDRPFVAINCAALPGNLLESELFGYEEGSFTGAKKGGKVGLIEMANEGTLFLDEIAEMPKHLQSRLLRVLQEKEILRIGDDKITPVDVRIIAATNRNLMGEVAKGRFREDLYYRLNILYIKVPSLHEMTADIPLLIESMIETNYPEIIQKNHNNIKKMAARLSKAPWPGNVRQLFNAVHRLAVIIKNNDIFGFSNDEIIERILDGNVELNEENQQSEFIIEMTNIINVLNNVGWDRNEAAKILGISRTTLWRKMNTLGCKKPSVSR